MSETRNTRMVCSTVLPCHLGYAYLALLNCGVAQESGGLCRFRLKVIDNNQDNFVRDMSWVLGVSGIEQGTWEDNPTDEVLDAVLSFRPEAQTAFLYPIEGCPAALYAPVHTSDLNAALTEYAPWDLALSVAWDNYQGITDVIQPERFMCDAHLRTYLCLRLGFAVPRQWYVPSLAFPQSVNSPDVSESFSLTISGLRERGWTPERVRDLLARSCLKDPALGWRLENIQPQPMLDIGGPQDGRTVRKPRKYRKRAPKEVVAVAAVVPGGDRCGPSESGSAGDAATEPVCATELLVDVATEATAGAATESVR